MVVWNICSPKQVNLPRLEHWVPHTAEVSSHFSAGIHSWEVFWGNCSLAWTIFSSWLNLVFQTRRVEGFSFSTAADAFLALLCWDPELALLRSPYLDLHWPLNPNFLLWSSCNAELRSALSLFLWLRRAEAGSSWVNFYQFGCSYLLWCRCSSISSSLPSTQPDTGSAQPWGNSSPGSVPVFGASLWHVIASHIAGEVLERHRSLSPSGAL